MKRNPDNLREYKDLPPHDLGAERAVIGSIIQVPDLIAKVRLVLAVADFFSLDHQQVFGAMLTLADDGKPAGDLPLIRAELLKRGKWEEIGGAAAFSDIAACGYEAHAIDHYAKLVRAHSLRRESQTIAREMVARAADLAEHPDALIDEIATRLANLRTRGRSGEYVTFDTALAQEWQNILDGGAKLIPTGLDELDQLVGGIGMGENVILAARPSMGKSALAKQLARNIARAGYPVGIISLEESPGKIIRNALASESEVDNRRIRSAKTLTPQEWNSLEAARDRLADEHLPIYITHRSRTIDHIAAVVRLWQAKHSIACVVVDHLGLVRTDGKTPYERASMASLEVSQLVKDCGLAGITLAQLNRAVTGRDDKRPSMADLRDAGRIEEDADAVLLLHREDYYHLADSDYTPTHTAELIIGKWRDATRGAVVKLISNLPAQRFDPAPVEVPHGL